MASPLSTLPAPATTTPAPAAEPSCIEAASAAVAVLGCPEGDEPPLDANRLHVYHVALELHCLCSTLVAMLHRIVKDQLERASLSVVLRRDKARFYAIARGSATETAALLDVLAMRRLASPAAIRTGRRLAIRIVQMLTRIDQKLVG